MKPWQPAAAVAPGATGCRACLTPSSSKLCISKEMQHIVCRMVVQHMTQQLVLNPCWQVV